MINRFIFKFSWQLILLMAFSGLNPLLAKTGESNPCCGPITAAGKQLSETLDSLHVEERWLNHEHVNWESGEPDKGEDYTGPGTHTHCSAFAAAAAKRMGVYLLRPPEHGQILLANAQAKWLLGEAGQKVGWQAVNGMQEAQRLANEGNLVLAVYQNPDAHRPGHVAIVRPSKRSLTTLEEDGPELISAGVHNHNRVNARVGFKHHPGAFPGGIRYYVYKI